MTRVNTAWVRWKAAHEVDAYMRQRAWHWAVARNFALTADYAIRLLNRHPRDPLALVLGELAGTRTNQGVFVGKCREAQRRLCFVKDVPAVLDLIPSAPTAPVASREGDAAGSHTAGVPSQAAVGALLADARAQDAQSAESGAVQTGLEDERMSVRESEPFEATRSAVKRGSQRAHAAAPVVELLDPRGSVYGRGLYATQRLPPRAALLTDQPYLVQRSDESKCAHCLQPLSSAASEVSCAHCSEETYCSRQCQEAAWQSYHACSCRSVNEAFANWAAAMRDTLYQSGADGIEDAASQARAALSCLAVSKVCAMATQQQVHPLALQGLRGLRGVADYEPATALSEIGGLAVALSTALHQPFLYMEEVLSLFAVLQTNEFLVEGGVALYPLLSLLNHSCEPNCTIERAEHRGGAARRVLVALRDIRDGEQLFIDYNTSLTTKLSYEQRKALCAQRHFECFCPKCVRRE